MNRLAFIGVVAVGVGVAAAAHAQTFDLDWHSIDGGGHMFSTGGGFLLGGTIGQSDAGPFFQPMTGGVYSLVGGFWPVAAVAASLPGDLDGDCDVDLQDLSVCLANFGCLPPPVCLCDIDGDGDGDLNDLALLLANFGTTCP